MLSITMKTLATMINLCMGIVLSAGSLDDLVAANGSSCGVHYYYRNWLSPTDISFHEKYLPKEMRRCE